VHVHRTVTRLFERCAERIEIALGRILEINWDVHVGHAEGVHSCRLVWERAVNNHLPLELGEYSSTLSVNRPMLDVVLKDWVTETKETP
jgi:hypothetical protein